MTADEKYQFAGLVADGEELNAVQERAAIQPFDLKHAALSKNALMEAAGAKRESDTTSTYSR